MRAIDLRRALANPDYFARVMGLKVVGKKVLCPSHGDKTPSCSMQVKADGTLWFHCFSCAWAGDALSFIQAANDLPSFKATMLAAKCLVGLSPPSVEESKPAQKALKVPTMGTDEFNEHAETLLLAGGMGDDAADYLKGRGIFDQANADGWFQLPGLDYRFLPKLKQMGLTTVNKRTGKDVLAFVGHRLCIPWRTPENKICNLQRRRMDEKAEKGSKYIGCKGRSFPWPYGVERLRDGADMVIVEGAADTLAARSKFNADIDVIGAPGTGGWRDEWGDLLNGRNFWWGFDNNAAGEELAVTLQARHGGARLLPPGGADDWAQ